MAYSEDYRAAEDVIRWLGASPVHLRVRQFTCALALIHEDGGLIFDVCGKLYPAVGERYGAGWKSVSQNLRRVRDDVMTESEPARLRTVLGRTPRGLPSVANLLDDIEYYMECEGRWPRE